MPELNQTPEQKARDNIDAMLGQAGWKVQHKDKIDLSAGLGIAVREYDTDVGPADYVLFVDRKAVGVIEAKSAPASGPGAVFIMVLMMIIGMAVIIRS